MKPLLIAALSFCLALAVAIATLFCPKVPDAQCQGLFNAQFWTLQGWWLIKTILQDYTFYIIALTLFFFSVILLLAKLITTQFRR